MMVENKKAKTVFISKCNSLVVILFLPFFLITCSTNKTNVLVKDGKRKRILVNNLDPLNNKNIKHMVAGISSSLTNGLSRVENLDVIGTAEKANGLKIIKEKLLYGEDIDTTELLSKLTSADYSCNGEIQTEGIQALVNIRISDSIKGNVVLSTSSKGSLEKPITLQENIIQNLLSDIDEKKTKEPLEKKYSTSTKNNLAFAKYSAAAEILFTTPKKAAFYLIEALKEDPEYIDAIDDLSFSLFQIGDLQSSKKFLKLKEEILRKRDLQKTEEYGETLCNLGVIEFELGNLKEAEKLCTEDRIFKEGQGSTKTKGYANTLQVLGGFAISKNDFKTGIPLLKRSRDIYLEIGLGSSLDYAELLITLGAAYLRNNEVQTAEETFLNSEAIYKKLDIMTTSSYASLLANQSMVHLKKEEYKEAVKKLILDKEIQDKLGLNKTKNYVTTLNNLAFVLNELGLKEKSAFFSKESKKIQTMLSKEKSM